MTQPTLKQSIDSIYSEILQLCLKHNLTREDFYFSSGKKGTQRRINAVAATDLLLQKTFFKNIRMCIHTRTSYIYHPNGWIYGPLSDNEVRWLLTQAIGKLEIQELIKPGYISQIFKNLKNNPEVFTSAAILLRKK